MKLLFYSASTLIQAPITTITHPILNTVLKLMSLNILIAMKVIGMYVMLKIILDIVTTIVFTLNATASG